MIKRRSRLPVIVVLLITLLLQFCGSADNRPALSLTGEGTDKYLVIQSPLPSGSGFHPITYCCIFTAEPGIKRQTHYTYIQFQEMVHNDNPEVVFCRDMNNMPAPEMEKRLNDLEKWQVKFVCGEEAAEEHVCLVPGRRYCIFIASLQLVRYRYPLTYFSWEKDKGIVIR